MTRARARQRIPENPPDIAGLWDALADYTERLGPRHPGTLAIAHSLAISLWHVGEVHNAAAVLKQAVASLMASLGTNHAATLAAKGDFAAILSELGREAEGRSLELETWEKARVHLGRTHAVTTVLAWNRALNCERAGDLDAAREIITRELTWLLTEPPAQLGEDQNIIRSMLAERLKWDDARAC